MYLNDIFTVTVNMAGLPGIAIPAGLSEGGLPLALQLIGKPFDEESLFRAAHVLEGRGYREIAAELQTSESVVRQRVSRGLSTLRRRIGAKR